MKSTMLGVRLSLFFCPTLSAVERFNSPPCTDVAFAA